MSQTRVLVVEDDAGLREALVDTLALAGYQWLEAESAEQALVLLKSEPIDIVVSDVQMAGMDGLALLRSIKLQWPKIPVLLMTAYANIEDAVAAMKDGAIDYMAKRLHRKCYLIWLVVMHQLNAILTILSWLILKVFTY